METCRIVLVAHMYDGDWQFMGNDDKEDRDIVAVHFAHVLDRDASLAELRSLGRGDMAYRVPRGEWVLEKFFSDRELEW